jgi:hypothetical protein
LLSYSLGQFEVVALFSFAPGSPLSKPLLACFLSVVGYCLGFGVGSLLVCSVQALVLASALAVAAIFCRPLALL